MAFFKRTLWLKNVLEMYFLIVSFISSYLPSFVLVNFIIFVDLLMRDGKQSGIERSLNSFD